MREKQKQKKGSTCTQSDACFRIFFVPFSLSLYLCINMITIMIKRKTHTHGLLSFAGSYALQSHHRLHINLSFLSKFYKCPKIRDVFECFQLSQCHYCLLPSPSSAAAPAAAAADIFCFLFVLPLFDLFVSSCLAKQILNEIWSNRGKQWKE